MRIISRQPGAQSASKAKPLPKPLWLRIRPPATDNFARIKSLMKEKRLNTVCSEAACPNAAECWSSGTATFMVLGDTCTRACRFCNVKSGNPRGLIDKNEPKNLVEAVKIMNLKYAVLTCVTRDDLPDGGAGHFADCIGALKKASPGLKIEVLISDLGGNREALKKIIAASPDVIGHNVETVARLQQAVRDPRAVYEKSLSVLRAAKNDIMPGQKLLTKSSVMVGLGETRAEVIQTMKDLRAANVDLLTIGQYLRPSPYHLPVRKYVTPAQFRDYEKAAKKLGFLACASGPFVRSSYRAGEFFPGTHQLNLLNKIKFSR